MSVEQRIRMLKVRNIMLGIVSSFAVSSTAFAADISAAGAEGIVRSAHCVADQTIESALQRQIGTSKHDLGWNTFENERGYTVEKVVSIDKSMQLRYRWQVNNEGIARPASERAEHLCLS